MAVFYKRVVESPSPMQKASGVLIEVQSMVMMALSKGERRPRFIGLGVDEMERMPQYAMWWYWSSEM